MAISYNWNVSTVDTYPTLDSNADVIYNVHWRITGTDDANNGLDRGQPLPPQEGSDSPTLASRSGPQCDAGVAHICSTRTSYHTRPAICKPCQLVFWFVHRDQRLLHARSQL